MSDQEQALIIEKSYLIDKGAKIKACLAIISAEYRAVIDCAEAEDTQEAADKGGVTVRESASEVEMQEGDKHEQGRPTGVQAETEEGQQERTEEHQSIEPSIEEKKRKYTYRGASRWNPNSGTSNWRDKRA